MSKKLVKSTFTFAGMTMLSRVMGFIRDIILAQVFGAGITFDAFIVAFRLPNFFRRIFGEGAFAQAFVPVLAQYSEQKDQLSTKEFVNRIAGTLSLILLVVVVIAEILSPFIVMIFAPGFIPHPEKILLTLQLLRITFPYLLFVSITAFLGATLNTFGKFGIPAFTPVLLNLSMIVAAGFVAPHFHYSIMVLAWGVFAGGILQIIVQWPSLKKLQLWPRFKLGFSDPGVRRVLKLMVPALFGVSVAQLSLLVDNLFASFLPTGSISWLYYSNRLTYLPLGVVGVAIATVILPQLSREHSRASYKNFSATLDWALKCILIIGMPAMIGLLMLAGPILATLFRHGKFSTYDVYMATKSLIAFSIGLPGFMAIKVLASGFYSKQNIKTPVKVAVIAMIVNLVLNVILIFPLKHAGLALATSLASFLNAGLLLYLLFKHKIYYPQIKWWQFIWKIIIASIVMVVFLYFLDASLKTWITWGLFAPIWHLAVLIFGSMIAYLLVLLATGIRLRDFKA